MLKEKIGQAVEILKERKIDLWLTFVRETETISDPCLDLIVGTNCTWQSAFMITADGRTIAIVGSLDKERIQQTGLYEDIRIYVDDFGAAFLKALDEIKPKRIAINTSVNDYMADGLTHGMYELLINYTKPTQYQNLFISAEKIVAALRGRKSPMEIELIKKSIELTEKIYANVSPQIKAGRTEKNIADIILKMVVEHGVETAWESNSCPAVFTGPLSAGAHADPTERVIQPGHVLNIDFGVKLNGYCSDIQRTWYILKDDEQVAPDPVQKGFAVLLESVRLAFEAIRPGKLGWEIDKIARDYIVANGYPEYQHGLGHQVGRSTHDGAGMLGPRWERYGDTVFLPLEVGQVYTIEPRLPIEGYGVATVEEMVVITPNGCKYLSHPQSRLFYTR
ncbi:MAG: Xaa-Pro peptidase family protein [Candidatus Marinimicrobia bacterium]|nr:Xaa-Pro peptidase family protein [Candidatus Neomarinimicrobiota bacterium]MDD5061799.1 Xaa-Pro peptidase family protein [Candidatus Neomarinimicrobiota bacterium]MDD5231132.1 Xaa-Pro peptidase family protein [Candidatus Neomarinimicrobiota bacterium]